MCVIGLPPGSRPGHEDSVVLHAPQACRLDEVGEAVSEVGRHHHVAEPFGSLRRHGRLDVLLATGGQKQHYTKEEVCNCFL